jgi:endonuclease/exonuclease/phosphatase (EEP) superfamily protein YafD
MRRLGDFLLRLLAALGLVAAFGFTAAALAAQGGRWNDRLDLFTHATPIWLAGGLASLAVALVMPSSRTRLLMALMGLVTTAASLELVAPEFMRARSAFAPTNAPNQLKVVEFNAWGPRTDPELVARWLASVKPDLVVIVEPTAALEKKIGEITGLQTWMGDGSLVASHQKVLTGQLGWHARDLPGQHLALTWVTLPGFDDRPYAVLGVHADWPIPSSRARGQAMRLAAVLDKEVRERAIVAGDFNSTEWSFRQRQADEGYGIERRDRAMPTWPARLPWPGSRPFPLPLLPIDHLYAGSMWRTVKVERGPRLGSDHYPLIVTLAWNGPSPARPYSEPPVR